MSKTDRLDTEVVGDFVLAGVVEPVDMGFPFDPRRERSRLAQVEGPLRSPGLDSADAGRTGDCWEESLGSVCRGFSSCRSFGPLCGGGVGLNRNSRRRCRRG